MLKEIILNNVSKISILFFPATEKIMDTLFNDGVMIMNLSGQFKKYPDMRKYEYQYQIILLPFI